MVNIQSPFTAVIDKYFAPKPAPSIHEQLNGWLSKAGEGEDKLDSDYEFSNPSITGGLSNAKAKSLHSPENDFRFILPAAKVRMLFEYFCSTELVKNEGLSSENSNQEAKVNLEQRMSEACEVNDMFTDLVYKTGELAVDKGWAQERGLNGAGQVMAYLKTQNDLYTDGPDLVCHREQISALSREFKEELFDSGIIPKHLQNKFKTICYDYLGYKDSGEKPLGLPSGRKPQIIHIWVSFSKLSYV